MISRSNVTDAVDKINAINGSTGVSAQATADNKVRLYAADGADVLIESQTAGQTALRVQSVSHDGESVQPSQVWHRAKAETNGGTGTIWFLTNKSPDRPVRWRSVSITACRLNTPASSPAISS